MVHYKLIYFDIRGRVEFIRYILAQAGADYEEKRVALTEWPSIKPTTIFGKIPILEIDGKPLGQSMSIARYLADKHGLSGSTEWYRAYADMIAHTIEDCYHHYVPFINGTRNNTEEEKAAAWKLLKDKVSGPLVQRFDKELVGKKWFCDNELTWADLYVAELSDRIHTCFDSTFLNEYPNVKEHMKRVHELPNIKKYLQNRPAMTF